MASYKDSGGPSSGSTVIPGLGTMGEVKVTPIGSGKVISKPGSPAGSGGGGGPSGGNTVIPGLGTMGEVKVTPVKNTQPTGGNPNASGPPIDRSSQAPTDEWPSQKSSEDDIIGLFPGAKNEPSGEVENGAYSKLVYASSPVLMIMPCLPAFGSSEEPQLGLSIFHLDEEKGQELHKKIVKVCGFNDNIKYPLKLAYLNEVNSGEQWGSQFQETTFEGLANTGSRVFQELRTITGTNNAADALTKIKDAMTGNKDTGLEKFVDSLMGGAAQGVGMVENALRTLGGDSAVSLMSGSKVDFPLIWSGSTFDPTYSFRIRLYNPYPNDQKKFEEYILYPLCKLLALVNPMSDSKYTYNYPLICKVKCKGLFDIPAAYVSNVEVIKGGENGDISWYQQPGSIDISLTINTLFSTMVASTDEETEKKIDKDRPTLKKYFDNMRLSMGFKIPTPDQKVNSVSSSFNETNTQNIFASTVSQITDSNVFERVSESITGITDQVSGLTNTVGNIANVFGATDITDITNNIDNVLSNVNNVSGSFTNVTNSINDVVNSLSGGISTIDGLSSSLNTISSSVGGIQSNLQILGNGRSFSGTIGTLNNIGNLTSDLTTFGYSIESLSNSFNTNYSGGMDDINDNIYTVTQVINQILSVISTFSSIKDSLDSNVVIVAEGIDTAGIQDVFTQSQSDIESYTDTFTSDIETFQDELNTQDENVSGIITDLNNMNFGSIVSDISSQSEAILIPYEQIIQTSNPSSELVEQYVAEINAMQIHMSSLLDQINTIQNQLGDSQDEIGTVNDNLGTLVENFNNSYETYKDDVEASLNIADESLDVCRDAMAESLPTV